MSVPDEARHWVDLWDDYIMPTVQDYHLKNEPGVLSTMHYRLKELSLGHWPRGRVNR